jgi:hypothetical protein
VKTETRIPLTPAFIEAFAKDIYDGGTQTLRCISGANTWV